ncbi:MAG TPA: tryptophan halogenase family protein [Woeseiaceae bacterium]|nr:tryptophan halogenase family protein [Woeseiaceae bacterium]
MRSGDDIRRSIVILGGGTAGWMAANLMAARWADRGFRITLIEAPDIGIIGVGEGSTPQLKGFMDSIGVDEADWMPACNATYKAGIDFRGWSSRAGFASYFHPFPAQPDDYTAPAFFYNSYVRRQGVDVEGHPDHFFLATYLAKHKLAPIAPEHFPFEINYGYHFDSGLLGQFLGQVAQARGVEHMRGKVTDVRLGETGNIDAVLTDDGRLLEADVFVDATGFRGLLIQQSLKVPFASFSGNLFNDAAVVMPTPVEEDLECQTISTAMKYGWAWRIPLSHRIGNGYVYSSDFVSSDEAEKELREHLGMLESDVQARHLKMRVGRVEQHWAQNCLAVGLSQGFIEPLEATALHLVQETVVGFIENYEAGDFTNRYQQRFNDSINERFENVRNYIVCHYRVNSRTDTEFWIENGRNEQLSQSLRSVLETWVGSKNLSDELARQKIDDYYPSISWHCLLAGYGLYPTDAQLKPGNELAHKYRLPALHDFIRRCAMNFRPHKEVIAAMQAEHPTRPLHEPASRGPDVDRLYRRVR